MIEDIEWYLQAIRHEIEAVNSKEFCGSVDFKINIRDGSIGNMNISLGKSVKKFRAPAA